LKPKTITRLLARAAKMKPVGKRAIVIDYILSRATYEPPPSASEAAAEEVCLSAAVAAARIISKSDDENGFLRDSWMKRLIAGKRDEQLPMATIASCVTGTLDEVASFYRNAQLARENFRVVDSRSLPLNDLAIIEEWMRPPQGTKRCLSLAECSAAAASEVLAYILNVGIEPKNWPRTKKRLGLVSFKHPMVKSPVRFA